MGNLRLQYTRKRIVASFSACLKFYSGQGAESGTARPVLILPDQVSFDIFYLSTLIVSLTTKLVKGTYPLRLRTNAQDKLKKNSDLLIDQMRAIDKRRLSCGLLTVIAKKQLQYIHDAGCTL